MALAAFATVQDLQAGWRTLAESEQSVAETLLLRATAQLSAMLARRGVKIDAEDEVQAANLAAVACNMVRRAMSAGDADGVRSVSQTIGSTTASVQWGNPDGAFYLSRMDREILGIAGRSAYRSVLASASGDKDKEQEG